MSVYETLFILEPLKIVMLLALCKEFGFVISKKKYAYFCVLIAVNMFLLYNPLSLNKVNVFFELIISIAVVYFSITCTGIENIKINLCILCTFILLDQVTINLISLFLYKIFSILSMQFNIILLHYVIDLILILMLYKINIKKKSFNFIPYIYISKIKCIVLILVTFIFDFLFNRSTFFQNDYLYYIEKLSLFFLVYILVITFWGIIVIGSFKEYYKETMNYKEVNFNLERKMFIEELQKDEEIKKFLHDFNNHLICIEHLIKSNKINEFEKYIMSIRNDISCNKVEKRIGIKAIDAVLYSLEMKIPPNTKIQWKGELNENIGISYFDLCIIYSNLFTNAIEAVAKIVDENNRKISVISKVVADVLYIKFENSVETVILISDNKLKTTKNEKERHGYGSINIRTCVQKYNGKIEYICMNNVFISEVYMKIP